MLKSTPQRHVRVPLSDGMDLRGLHVDPILVANDPAALRGALLCGEGLMLAADVDHGARSSSSATSGACCPRGTDPKSTSTPCSPRGQVPSPKIRAFVDFLLERLNFDADYMAVICPDKQRYEKLAHEASAAVAADLMRTAKPVTPMKARELVGARG
jgi:hypothetical protein